MRQALNTLHVSGLLRHPSTRVLEVTTVTHEDIVEIYRARRFLELAGVEAAADTPPEGLAGIQEAVLEMERALQENDIDRFVQADYRCHREVVGLLRSRYLSQTHAQLMAKLRLAITKVTTQEQDNGVVLAPARVCDLLTTGRLREAQANLEQRLIDAEQSILPEATVRD